VCVTKRPLFFCLAAIIGTSALAQKPQEWRPDIGADNKSATWDATSSFLIGTLSNLSPAEMNATTEQKCFLEWNTYRNVFTGPFGIGIAMINARMVVTEIRPGSFGEQIGLNVGMEIISVNKHKITNLSDLNSMSGGGLCRKA
jgi:hypothetical protein